MTTTTTTTTTTTRYKMRIYHTKGPNKGQLDREELFNTLEDANNRYRELFNYNSFGLNPTIWRFDDDTQEYIRVKGY